VQAPGGVGDHQVDVAGGGPFDGVEHHRAGVTSLVAAHELGAGPLGPRGQLLGGGGAKRVRGGNEHGATVRPLLARHLADAGRLADSVDADEQPHVRAPGLTRLEVQVAVGTSEPRLHLGAQGVEELIRLGDLGALDLGAQPVEQVAGDAHSHVGPQQRLLEVIPRLVGDAASAPDAGEGAGERGASPRHPLPQRRRRSGHLGLEHGRRRRFETWFWRCGRRRDRRCGRRFDRALSPAPVDDQDGDPEGDHQRDQDEVDPLHRRPTLPVCRFSG
jgi:hypothetical protein